MYSLRPLSEDDLELVLAWRNRPEIRRNMYTQHEISFEEHKAWFVRLKGDQTKRYFICLDDDTPVGVVNFVDISVVHRTASWGFYSGDTSKRGVGSQMEFLALNYAFEELGLEKLCCEVLSSNYPVVRFHRKFGFEIEGVFKRHFFDGDQYQDIYRLAIFRTAWLEDLKPKFRAKLNREVSFDSNPIEVGDAYSEAIVLTQEAIESFAEVTGRCSSADPDAEATKTPSFTGAVGEEMLAGSAFFRIFGTKFPGAGTRYLSQRLTFNRPISPGKELVAMVRVVTRVGRRLVLETTLKDADGNSFISGEAELMLPDHVEGMN